MHPRRLAFTYVALVLVAALGMAVGRAVDDRGLARVGAYALFGIIVLGAVTVFPIGLLHLSRNRRG